MARVETAQFELSVVEFGLRRECQEAHEDLVIPGFFALLEQGFGMQTPPIDLLRQWLAKPTGF